MSPRTQRAEHGRTWQAFRNESMSELTLICECGGVTSSHTFRGPDEKTVNKLAVDMGWRIHKGKTICPNCEAKVARRMEKAAQKRREASV